MRHYYALRRFCPYQGVIQVVDAGNARAYSTDGRHWQIRIQNQDRQAEVPAGVGGGRSGARATTADEFMEVLNQRPALPFPLDDRVELWLLRKDTQLPLALIKTRRSLADAVIADARARHPYDEPAFVVLPIDGGAAGV